MASRREVKILITADASQVDRAVGQVESRFGKLGNVMRGALVGVSFAAIGRGVMNMANDFQDAAISANDFATASGLSVEQASRWQEVAGDVGVEASKLQTVFGRLSKGLGQDRTKWQQYGVAVETAADGTVDANKTFLNAVNALTEIQDPLERAKVGSELFGRSWMDVAPLIELGAEGVTEALNAVGEAQVINEEEVDKAKRFRDTMDELSDATMGVKMELAEALMPAIAGFAGFLADNMNPTLATTIAALAGGVGLAWAIGKVTGAIQGTIGMLDLFAKHPVIAATLVVVAGLAYIVTHWDQISAAIQGAINKVDEFARKISGPLYGPVKAINNLFGGNLGKGTDLSTPALKQYQQTKSLLGPKTLAYVEGRASGGPVMAGDPYVIGESGPELFVPRQSGRIIPNHAMGGTTITQNFTVVAGPGMDELALARAVVREQNRALRAAGIPSSP
jgi:hypothetical protein